MIKSAKASHGNGVIELLPVAKQNLLILNAILFPEEKKLTSNYTETSEKVKKLRKESKAKFRDHGELWKQD